jgi:hypothetical protein
MLGKALARVFGYQREFDKCPAYMNVAGLSREESEPARRRAN